MHLLIFPCAYFSLTVTVATSGTGIFTETVLDLNSTVAVEFHVQEVRVSNPLLATMKYRTMFSISIMYMGQSINSTPILHFYQLI